MRRKNRGCWALAWGLGMGGRSVYRQAGLGGLWQGEERQSLGVGTDQLVP